MQTSKTTTRTKLLLTQTLKKQYVFAWLLFLGLIFNLPSTQCQTTRTVCNEQIWVNHEEAGYRGLYTLSDQVINGESVFTHENTAAPVGSQYRTMYMYRFNSLWVLQPVTPEPGVWLANTYTEGPTPWGYPWSRPTVSVECVSKTVPPVPRTVCNEQIWVNHEEAGYRGLYTLSDQVINGESVFTHENTAAPVGSQYRTMYMYRFNSLWVLQPVTPEPGVWLANTYTEGPTPWGYPWSRPTVSVECRTATINPQVFWNRNANMQVNKTTDFITTLDAIDADPNWQLVARRGMQITINDLEGLVSENGITVRHKTAQGSPSYTWRVSDGRISLGADMGVGIYEVESPSILAGHQIIVLFNPYTGYRPDSYNGSQLEIDFWIHSDRSGYANLYRDGNTMVYRRYPLDFYEPVVFRNILKLLEIGANLQTETHSIQHLSTPWNVMRSFTWLLHDKDYPGVSHAAWSAGTLCPNPGGLDSESCKGSSNNRVDRWMAEWEEFQLPIWTSNCQDLASMYCAAGRLLGIASRVVTGSSVGQGEVPTDRVLDIKNTGTTALDSDGNQTEILRTRGNNALWSNHVWAEIYLNSSPLSTKPGWYIAEPTPSIISKGKHQAGPIPLEQVKANDIQVIHDPAIAQELAYFISMTKGYVWLGKKAARGSILYSTISEASLPISLFNLTTGPDISFQEWQVAGYQPQNYACYLNKCIILEGYKGSSINNLRSYGHVYTMAPTCPNNQMDQYNPAYPFNTPQLGNQSNYPFDGTAEQCLLSTTHLYKDSFDEGPFDKLSDSQVPPYVLLQKQSGCGCLTGSGQ